VKYGTVHESEPHPNPPRPGMVLLTVEGEQCKRCEHEWIPKLQRVPRVCPKCKSPYWNTSRNATRSTPISWRSTTRTVTGRPPVCAGEPMRSMSLYVPAELHDRLRKEAAESDTSVNRLARDLLADGILRRHRFAFLDYQERDLERRWPS